MTRDESVFSLDRVVAGAVYDFAAYLTTQGETLEVGARHEPGPLIDLLKAWAGDRSLPLDGAWVRRWQDALSPLGIFREFDKLVRWTTDHADDKICGSLSDTLIPLLDATLAVQDGAK